MGAWYGLDVRDPTLDRRVIEFCVRTPDYLFRRKGMERWLILQAMAGGMPAEVLSNRKFGCQSADLGHRVVRERTGIEAVLDRLERSELSRRCLDLAKMRRVLASLDREVTRDSTRQSVTILLRGIEIGLFLSRF
jgi:asparagine synthase (glutamine-hydrolysing)